MVNGLQTVGAGVLWALATATSNATSAATCDAPGSTPIRHVVELYTSEGCSSCPPADRWLSTFKGREDTLALSFHVNYWDYIGWKDPYALRESTARQHDWRKHFRSTSVYTPQVIANGQDWRAWRWGKALPTLPESSIQVHLTRQPDGVHAQITGGANGAHYGAYWAYLQDDASSRVRAGENAGETLTHDHVVRWLRAEPTWSQQAQFTAPAPGPGTDRVALVVTEADGLRPVAAAVLPLCK